MICVVISTIQSRGGHHAHAITKTPYSWFFCVVAILPLPCWWIFPLWGSPYRHHAHQQAQFCALLKVQRVTAPTSSN